MVFKVTKSRVVLEQFHKSVASARTAISKSLNSPHGTLGKDFPDFKLGSVKAAPKGVHGEPNVRKHGRKLYRITLVRRKILRKGRVFISSAEAKKRAKKKKRKRKR